MTTPRFTHAVIDADPTLPIIHITRDFRAPIEHVRRAHLDPVLFAKWTGPRGMENRIAEWDARDGGSWRYVAQRGSEEYGFRGCFHQITAERIVQTFTYEGEPDAVALETLRFVDIGDGWTRLSAQALVESMVARDAWLASGMEIGVHDGYAKLDSLLTDPQTGAESS